MAPFYGWGSTTSRLEPLERGSLLFTTKFPETSTISLSSFITMSFAVQEKRIGGCLKHPLTAFRNPENHVMIA